MPSLSGSSGHDPPSARARASPEGRETRKIGRTGEETEIGSDAELAAHTGASPAVPTSHQVGELSFDLRPRLAVVGSPLRIGLLSARPCEGGLVHSDADLPPERRRRALLGERAGRTVLGEFRDPSSVFQPPDAHRDLGRAGDRVGIEVDPEQVLREQPVLSDRWLGLELRVDAGVGEEGLELAGPVGGVAVDGRSLFWRRWRLAPTLVTGRAILGRLVALEEIGDQFLGDARAASVARRDGGCGDDL
jgi:hypothetical protein